jgi:hypothetical protein
MKLDFEGRTWHLDLEDVTVLQGETITSYTGLTVLGWYNSLGDADSQVWLKSMRCLYWLMREQNPDSDPVPVADVNPAPLKLLRAYNEGYAAEHPDAAAEADPTRPGAVPDAEPTLAPEDSRPG